MKLNLLKHPLLLLACCGFLLSGCGTIIGGSNYYGFVTIEDHPNATITYRGYTQKNRRANFRIKRADANRVSFTVREKNCKDQVIEFHQRQIRPWALTGSVVFWTGVVEGVPIPWGTAVDLITGALWKPDVNEPGVIKIDYKHFEYQLDYTGCVASDVTAAVSK